MPKDLLQGIMDKETGDLLDRKGRHVKKGSAGGKGAGHKGWGGDAGKGGGQERERRVKLAIVVALLLCSAGALTWSVLSVVSPLPDTRTYVPGDDAASTDPMKTPRKDDRPKERQWGNFRIVPSQ